MEYLETITNLLKTCENAEKAEGMERYMKNHFPFLGVPKPVRAEILNPILKEIKRAKMTEILPLVLALWDKPEREFQYVAMDILASVKLKWTEGLIVEIETFIRTKSWWDTVDMLATQMVGGYFQRFPTEKYSIITKWIEDEDKWINRSAILFQLKYKQKTDTDLLQKTILPHTASKEFFLQKAIGWVLREHSATDVEWVQHFLDTYPLKPLSIREAKRGVERSRLKNRKTN